MLSLNDLERNAFSPQDDYCRYHPRVWETIGAIVDLGCYGWNWSRPFIGKRQVFGVDPLETTCPEGAVLFNGFVGSVTGYVDFEPKADIHSTSGHLTGKQKARIYSFDYFRYVFNLSHIAILKMNIEGMEYEILINLKEPVADQIIVAFHYSEKATEAIRNYLEQWYEWIKIDEQWNWYLFLKN